MAKKIIKFSLSNKSINEAIKQLEDYRSSLQYKARMFVERMAEEGVEIARYHIGDLDAVLSGELIQSIHSEYKNSTKDSVTFCVVADSEHALYVELGTGMVGAENPYPGKIPVVYAQGKYIKKTEDGRYYWFYQKEEGGQWYYTEGMPSRPFMYNTSLDLAKIASKIAKEVFR